MRYAPIHQRATSAADQRIADRLSALVDKHRTGKDDDGGAAGRRHAVAGRVRALLW
jgi:hypothetical protein